MRTSTSVTLAIQILGLAGLGMAADPIIGIWRLNLSQSKFSPARSDMIDPRPKLHIETYREIEDRIEVSGTVTRLDGSSTSGKLSWPKQGGVLKFENAAVSDLSIVEALLAPGEWLAITMRDGRQVGTRRKVISKDGKTMRQTVRVFAPDGKSIEQVEVYDRQ
jgi:hypothetical protein